MSSTLHIDPEQLYQASRTLVHTNDQAADALYNLRLSVLRLEAAWISPQADDYMSEMKTLLLQIRLELDEMLTMSLILSRQADMWQETDQHWAREYRERFLPRIGE
jgi:hypothetical protein